MANKKLLVEGNDDKHVMLALCEKFDIPENFEIIDCQGISNILERFPIDFKTSGTKTVGVIVDADTDIRARWASLKTKLESAGFAVPDNLPESGLIAENHSGQKAGVWIMPNNEMDGMLEDFMSFLVPHDDNLMPIVGSTLDDIELKRLNKYKNSDRSKANIHTWLAWQDAPGTPLGLSITKRYLTTEEEICEKLTDWLKNCSSDLQ